jgi:DUF917 family protein
MAGSGLFTVGSDINTPSESTFALGLDEGNDAGHTYQLGVKNENLVSYYDGEVDVTIPDLICVIDENTGDPVTNPHYEIGQSLVVIILPAHDAFLTPKGLATFGPAYVGVDAPYRPASLQNRHNK